MASEIIRTNTFNNSDVRRSDAVNSKDKKEHAIVNVEIPMFNGQVIGPDKYGSNRGQLVIDLKSVGPEQSEKNASNPDLPKYTGRTESNTPVHMTDIEDLRDGVNPIKHALVIDTVALARATYDIKDEYAKKNPDVRAPHPSTRDRLDVTAGWSTTKNGVGAMSLGGMEANVSQIAAQNYMFTASPKKPDEGKPSKDDITKVAEIISNTYTEVAKGIEKGDYAAGLSSKKDASKVIPGTTLGADAFAKNGLKVCEVDGATVIAAVDMDKSKEASARQVLESFSKIVNAKVSQQVNDVAFKESDSVKKLANLAKINSYPVNPYADGKKMGDLTVVQPSVNVTFQPYASALAKTVNIMRREPEIDKTTQQSVIRTPNEVYGDAIVKNAKSIHEYFKTEADASLTKEQIRTQAIENQSNFVDAIRAAVTADDKSATKALKSKAAKTKDTPDAPTNEEQLGG